MKDNPSYFKPGNELYQLRLKDGKDKEYTPEDFIEKIQEYFNWSMANPLKEQQIVKGTFTSYRDVPYTDDNGDKKTKSEKITKHYQKVYVDKMRPLTIGALCIYAGICNQTFYNYKKHSDYIDICTRASEIIDDQQFQGGAAGFLNPSIIAMKLGLVAKKDITTKGEKVSLTESEREDRIEALIRKHNHQSKQSKKS